MLSKNHFFKNFSVNLKKTKETFNILVKDIENFDIPLLQSYNKNCEREERAENCRYSQLETRHLKPFSSIIPSEIMILTPSPPK